MKVNTDGVLLGAWADVDRAKRILDIGTGTGVIALMMAQKNELATIDAIDVDEDAYQEAKENFETSLWSSRLQTFHSSLQTFEPGKKYEVIISNPPYFIDDYKTGKAKKDVAKHSTELNYVDLLSGINRLLDEHGKVFLVIPLFNFERVKILAEAQHLYVTAITEVTATSGKAAYVVLLKLERIASPYSIQTLQIQNGDGIFTDDYKLLTKDFYLKF